MKSFRIDAGPIIRGAEYWQRSILGLLSPPECVWCKRPLPSGGGTCGACRTAIVSDYYRCQRCATPLPTVVTNVDCFRCRDKRLAFQSVQALGPYRGRLRDAAIMMKKPGAEPMRRESGRLLAEVVRAKLADGSLPIQPSQPPVAKALVIPVPNHWTHHYSKKADTASSLALAFAEAMELPVKTRVVRRIRKTDKQGMLSWTERSKNVAGAFRIRHAQPLNGAHVYVVDDVLTSGATGAELAKVLRRAGARRIDLVVVARGTGARESTSGGDANSAVSANLAQPRRNSVAGEPGR